MPAIIPFPRVINRPPILASPLPRVPTAIAEADCCIRDGGKRVQMVGMAFQVAVMPMQLVETRSQAQTVEKVTPRQGTHGPPIARPNYILQDNDDDEPNHRYSTRLWSTSIMQEAMLTCIDITKPRFNISAAKVATPKFPMIWFCKMANSVFRKQGKLLEYCHLITNPKTWATWTHSYGNKLGWLAKGMPGRVTGTDTIFFIPKDKVLRARAKDIMYSFITCLIRPEKTKEPNRTKLVAGGDRLHYPFNAVTLTTNLLTIKLLINSQQCDLHTQGKILHIRHQELLPMHAHDKV
jgi:hypothetical protein